MKVIAVAISALMMAPAAAQDDAELKKKRLGILMKQMNVIQAEAQKLLNELSGGDPSKIEAIMKEVAQKYAPEMAAEMGRGETAANERNASATLKTLASAQADFRANDRDRNKVQDFWVADVSGLYRVDGKSDFGAIKLIEFAVAAADAKPCLPLDKEGLLPGAAKEHASKLFAVGVPSPKAGYRFVAVEKFEDENGVVGKYNDGNGRNPAHFGFCAVPVDYGKTGKHTFILNENNMVWRKDTGGKPVEVVPLHPRDAGWTPLD